MGMFSSRKKTVVGTSISRVIEDRLLPDAVKTGLLRGVFNDSSQMSNYIMEELINSMANKAGQMYHYGKTQYTNGLPEMTIVSEDVGENVVRGLIEENVGTTVTFYYYKDGTFNSLHYGWTQLHNSYGYDRRENELTVLSAQKGFPVYLQDMVVVVPSAEFEATNPEAFEQWGPSPRSGKNALSGLGIRGIQNLLNAVKHTPVQVSTTASQEHLVVKYAWTAWVVEKINNKDVGRWVPKQEEMIIPVPVMDEDAHYIQCMAVYNTQEIEDQWIDIEQGGAQITYKQKWVCFTYKAGEGTYPEIDTLYDDSYQGLGSFFPWAYFRNGKQKIDEDKNSEEYKTTKKMVKYLGIDYDQMSEAINTNPDIGTVENAILYMGVPPVSTNPIECEYLFDFFKKVYYECGLKGIKFGSPLLSEGMQSIQNLRVYRPFYLRIQDARFTISIGIRNATRKLIAGNIGSIGSCTTTLEHSEERNTYQDPDTMYPHTVVTPVTKHIYRKQTSATIYEEIAIYQLVTQYHLNGLSAKYFTTSDKDGELLYIPLDFSITEKYGTRDREELYARSLHFIFNSVDRIKIKWYQSDWFQFVLIAAAVVITVFTGFSDGGQGLAFVTALADSAYMLAASIAIKALAYGFLINQALQLFVKLVGPELAIALTIVAIAYLGYLKSGGEAISLLPSADKLLQVVNGLFKATSDVMQQALLGLKEDAEAFQTEVETKNKLLEEANDLLWVDPILKPIMLFGEKPEQYFYRTVHSGNIGAKSFDHVHDFVGTSLRLPTLMDTDRLFSASVN